MASNVIRGHLAQLVRLAPSPIRSERLILGSAPSELHDIGALMVALFLRRRGFDVVFAGASVEPRSLRDDLARIKPAAVCLSASTEVSAHVLAGLYQSIRGEYEGVLAFGGRIYQAEPGMIKRTRGTYLGADAQTAVQALERLLA